MSTKVIDTNKDFFKCIFGEERDSQGEAKAENSFKGTNRIKKFRKFASLDLNIKKDKIKVKRDEYVLSDHYDFLENLGIGTYSYVKHAVDKVFGKHVAIKICRRKTAREMLKNEYKILQRISHPAIIKPYEFIDNDNKDESYLIMEYFEGKELKNFIDDSHLTMDGL